MARFSGKVISVTGGGSGMGAPDDTANGAPARTGLNRPKGPVPEGMSERVPKGRGTPTCHNLSMQDVSHLPGQVTGLAFVLAAVFGAVATRFMTGRKRDSGTASRKAPTKKSDGMSVVDTRYAQSSIGSPRWASSKSRNAVTRRPSCRKLPGPVSPCTIDGGWEPVSGMLSRSHWKHAVKNGSGTEERSSRASHKSSSSRTASSSSTRPTDRAALPPRFASARTSFCST